ncbi:MAG: diversity-generating retroelement protein Avd [bacterium]|nr:diversity-generating retroelement protein Avd [bacterium]
MSSEMVIFSRTYDLLLWIIPHCDNFPKAHRHGITQRLQDALLDFMETVYDANAQAGKPRSSALARADAHLNKVRLYLRMAHQFQWLSVGQYEHVSNMVAEIGKLLGGWIKQTG